MFWAKLFFKDTAAHPQLREVREDLPNATNLGKSTLMSVITKHSESLRDRLTTSIRESAVPDAACDQFHKVNVLLQMRQDLH